MNNRKYDELEPWEKAFYNLNMKVGNDIWGARMEGDGSGGHRMRIFVNYEEAKNVVLLETGGEIEGIPIVFTEYNQEVHALREAKFTNQNRKKKETIFKDIEVDITELDKEEVE